MAQGLHHAGVPQCRTGCSTVVWGPELSSQGEVCSLQAKSFTFLFIHSRIGQSQRETERGRRDREEEREIPAALLMKCPSAGGDWGLDPAHRTQQHACSTWRATTQPLGKLPHAPCSLDLFSIFSVTVQAKYSPYINR